MLILCREIATWVLTFGITFANFVLVLIYKNIAIALAAIAGYRDRSILSFLYHSINLAIYSMDKQKNVCYN